MSTASPSQNKGIHNFHKEKRKFKAFQIENFIVNLYITLLHPIINV
jgi:hypothetical protein